MTKCPDEKVLHSFADGELKGLLRSRVSEHVVSCERCAREVRQLQTMGQLVSSAIHNAVEDYTIPPLWERVRHQLTPSHGRDRGWRSLVVLLWKPAARVAYAALIVFFSAFFALRSLLTPPVQEATIHRAKVHSVYQFNPDVTVSMMMASGGKPAVVWISGIGPSEEN